LRADTSMLLMTKVPLGFSRKVAEKTSQTSVVEATSESLSRALEGQLECVSVLGN
jgi:hypothetical protein